MRHSWPGSIAICGAVAGSSATVYGSGPRKTATSPARSGTRVAAVVDRPRLAAHHRQDGQRRLVLDAQRPRRVEARAEQERLAGTGAVEQAGDRIHAQKRRRSRMRLRAWAMDCLDRRAFNARCEHVDREEHHDHPGPDAREPGHRASASPSPTPPPRTGGELLAFDFALRPGGAVPIPHVHPIQTERFEVVAGRMRFRVGLRTVIAGPGDVVEVRARRHARLRQRRRRGGAAAGRGPARAARWRRCSPRSSRWPRPGG